jgi:hypothetical protein
MTSDTGALGGFADEKAGVSGLDNATDAAREAAGRGHAATDQYGRALIEFDRTAERHLRLKIDLYIIPTVALLYLFCFIDRANIGMSCHSEHSTYKYLWYVQSLTTAG